MVSRLIESRFNGMSSYNFFLGNLKLKGSSGNDYYQPYMIYDSPDIGEYTYRWYTSQNGGSGILYGGLNYLSGYSLKVSDFNFICCFLLSLILTVLISTIDVYPLTSGLDESLYVTALRIMPTEGTVYILRIFAGIILKNAQLSGFLDYLEMG